MQTRTGREMMVIAVIGATVMLAGCGGPKPMVTATTTTVTTVTP